MQYQNPIGCLKYQYLLRYNFPYYCGASFYAPSVLYEDVVQNYRKGKDIRLFGMDRLIVREGEKMVDSFAPYARQQIWLSQVSGMAGSILSLLIAGISFVAIGRYALAGYIAPGNVISFA